MVAWAQKPTAIASVRTHGIPKVYAPRCTTRAQKYTTDADATAAVVYFWARVVHLAAYTFGIPWVRTLAFAVGFFAQATIAWQILMK
jgi:uncharacterized MAPEG superfamily protein